MTLEEILREARDLIELANDDESAIVAAERLIRAAWDAARAEGYEAGREAQRAECVTRDHNPEYQRGYEAGKRDADERWQRARALDKALDTEASRVPTSPYDASVARHGYPPIPGCQCARCDP